MLPVFDRMLESTDPESILDSEPDAEIRDAARDLWRRHCAAEAQNFLGASPELVAGLREPDRPVLPEKTLLVGGRFEVIRMLGRGGMGEVYLANDRVLGEPVAIKTIQKRLAAKPEIQKMFIAEIQNARRVNHDNVCRIFDLFVDANLSFFSMEYVDGERLADRLGEGLSGEESRSIALRLAEGLAKLHATGIIHGDFKPGNVILDKSNGNPRPVIMDFGLARPIASAQDAVDKSRGGTPDYMAPELVRGAPVSVQGDIFAFGKVLALLMPGHRLVERCCAERPDDRPASMASIVETLKGNPSRRLLLGGAGAGLGLGALAYFGLEQARPIFADRQTVAVNGFHSADESLAKALKLLLVTALHQSPLISLVTDDSMLSAMAQLGFPARFPLRREHLLAVASERRIPFFVEGQLAAGSAGLKLLLQLFERNQASPLLTVEESARDRASIPAMADRAAVALRKAIGETPVSMNSSYVSLEQATSKSTEAIELLIKGIDEYEASRAEAAVTLFEEAARIDPQFALAWAYAGLAAAARFRAEQAANYFQKAFELRQRVSERERLWIEGRYHNNTGNFLEALKVSKKLALLFPDDGTFQRNLAFAHAREGSHREAIPANRRAVEIDPRSNNNQSELIVNLAEGGDSEAALAAYQQFRGKGNTSSLLDWGAGLAYLTAGRYDEAAASFAQMGTQPARERWARLVRCAPLILQGRFSQAIDALESDLAHDLLSGEQNRRQIRRIWLGYLYWLTDSPHRAAVHVAEILKLPALPVYLQQFREAGAISLAIGDLGAGDKALDILRRVSEAWPSTHSRGAFLLLQGALQARRADDAAAARESLVQARGLWPDPLTLHTIAEIELNAERWDAAQALSEEIAKQRGRIFKHLFPGLFTLNQIRNAKSLAGLSRWDDASRMYQQIVDNWHAEAMTYRLGRSVRGDFERVRTRALNGGRHG